VAWSELKVTSVDPKDYRGMHPDVWIMDDPVADKSLDNWYERCWTYYKEMKVDILKQMFEQAEQPIETFSVLGHEYMSEDRHRKLCAQKNDQIDTQAETIRQLQRQLGSLVSHRMELAVVEDPPPHRMRRAALDLVNQAWLDASSEEPRLARRAMDKLYADIKGVK